MNDLIKAVVEFFSFAELLQKTGLNEEKSLAFATVNTYSLIFGNCFVG